MQESLYERFRSFKPYDVVLVVTLVVLAAVSDNGRGLLPRLVILTGGLGYFLILDSLQKLVRVPTPLWQALTIVALHTATITLILHHGDSRFALAFYILNVGYATIAFGEQIGVATALLSVLAPVHLQFMDLGSGTARLLETGMVLLVLLTMVAILTRINHLQEQAIFDAVTGLRNHRYFQIRLREELSRSDRQDVPTSLLLLDLDNFKKVNDQHGHAIGDQVLRLVAQTLVLNARTSDVVCRYGGEEMAVILPETALPDAEKAAERLRRAVESTTEPGLPHVTVSIGVASYPDYASQADTLIATADAAMYQAKKAGKNCVKTAPRPRDATITP